MWKTIHVVSWLVLLLLTIHAGRADEHGRHLRQDDHRELQATCNGNFSIVKAGLLSTTPLSQVVLGTYVNGSTIDIAPFNNVPLSLVVNCMGTFSYLNLKYLQYTTRETIAPYALKANVVNNYIAEPDLSIAGNKSVGLVGFNRQRSIILDTKIVFKIIKCPICGTNAKCVDDNKCVCNQGYSGNGFICCETAAGLVFDGEEIVCIPSLVIAWTTSQEGIWNDGGWKVDVGGTRIRFNVENSYDCGGTVSNVQVGRYFARITTLAAYNLEVAIVGKAEPGIEKVNLFLDDVLVIEASSDASGLDWCTMGDVVATYRTTPPYVLEPGDHTFQINFSSSDGSNHKDAFFEFNLNFIPQI